MHKMSHEAPCLVRCGAPGPDCLPACVQGGSEQMRSGRDGGVWRRVRCLRQRRCAWYDCIIRNEGLASMFIHVLERPGDEGIGVPLASARASCACM
jgi:hypothetical protein